MAFTSWADLHTKMLDDLAAGSWRTAEYEVGSVRRNFTSFGEFEKVLNYVERKAQDEAGTAPPRRTYAKQGGRG